MSLCFQPVFAQEGLTKAPVVLYNLFGFPITNSLISEIIVTGIIIAVIQTAMRAPKIVPTGMQNFVEWIVEAMMNFLEMLMGRPTTKRGFWYFGRAHCIHYFGQSARPHPGRRHLRPGS